MLDVLRKCWWLVGRDAPGRWLFIIALAIVLSGVEAVSALLVFVLLSLVTSQSEGIEIPGVGDARQLIPGSTDETLFLATAGFIVLFFTARGFLLITQAYVENRVLQNAAARLSTRLLRGYLALPYAFHLHHNSAELIRNVYQSVRHLVRMALSPIVKAASEAFLVFGLLGVMLVVAPAGVLLAAAVLGPLAYILLRVVHPRLKYQGRVNQSMEKKTLQAVQQSLGGMRDIKVGGRETYFLRDFGRSRRRLARVQYLLATLKAVPRVGIETTMVVLVAVLFFTFTLADGSPEQALPVLGLFAYGAFRLKQPLNNVLRGVNSLRFAGPAVDDVYQDMVAGATAMRQESLERSFSNLPFRERIEFDSVFFRYDGAPHDALQDVNVVIRRGQSLGVVGPTGGGKSTFVDLLLGLLDPSKGTIRVDGVDITKHRRAWQRNLGVVSQSVFLIDDTIRANIALGVSEDEIDHARVASVMRMVQLDPLISSLPEGLGTVVGERGVRLSGGQRQRVAIARALYHDPEVLVLDEGTSALDNATEAALMKTLENIRGARTLVIVAHRLTTVRKCDRIAVMEDGRVAAIGTYHDLVARSSLFRDLTQEVAHSHPQSNVVE